MMFHPRHLRHHCTPLPRRLQHGLAVLLAVLIAPLAGCFESLSSGTPPVVWAAGPSQRIDPRQAPDEANAYYDRRQNLVSLSGAANETIGFELVLAAVSGSTGGLKLSADDMVGPGGAISRQNIRAYRQVPVTVDRFPNWYLRKHGLRETRLLPDALLPVAMASDGADGSGGTGSSISVSTGQNLPLFIEVFIPENTAPGVYKTNITIGGSGRQGVAVQTPVELLVRGVLLGDQFALPVPARVQLEPLIAAETSLDPRNLRVALEDAAARRVIEQACALLQSHGLSPHCDGVVPRFAQDQRGTVSLEWGAYDAFCGPMVDGSGYADGKAAWAWPIPANMQQLNPAQFGGMDSAMYTSVVQDYLAKSAAHFAAKGWLERSFVLFDYPTSANPTQQDIQRVRRLIAATRKANERLVFVSTLIPQSMRPFGWFEHRFEDLTGEVDVWATPARYQHPATLARLHGMGKRTWLVPDRPPYSGSLAVEAPLTHARSLAWQAFLQGHEAIYLASTTQWPEKVLDRAISDPDQPSDTWLIYPGEFFGLDEPVPSMRLKQLRIGLQEYRYLRILAEQGRRETARLIASSLIKATGSDAYGDNYQDGLPHRRVDEPRLWDLARRLLLEETELAAGGTSGANLEANRGAWVELLESTRRLDAWIESARVKALPSPQQGFGITFDAVVRTELRTPVQGKFEFGRLPDGAEKLDTETSVTGLQEMGVAKRRLGLRMLALPLCDLEGHFLQPISFNAGSTGNITEQAVLSIVQVKGIDGPIRIDGDLGDWPPGTTNVAGDFRIIGAEENPERVRAESQTVAYFCTADDMLFIGMHAATPSGSAPRRPRETNVVEYEDLRPTSGDLIEIMIDPTGAATRPDDVFHVVIQSTGDPVFEQGVSVSPPIGKVASWPGTRPSYAVTRHGDGWTAELAIPISALGKTTGTGRVWGVNVARLEPIRGEYSDWARAPRYCYDPRTLGNLVWPASTVRDADGTGL